MAKTYKDYDSSRLQNLSDKDFDRLYYDAKTGMRPNSDSYDQEGHREGGYTQGEFYADSLEPYHGMSKSDQELAELYRKNVFGQATTGNDNYLSGYDEDSRRMGFEMVFREKDRRRGLTATAATTDDVVEEPVQHYDLKRLESNNENNDGSIQQAKDRVKAFGESTNDRIDSYYPKSQFEKAQDLMASTDDNDDDETNQAQSFANNFKNNFKDYLNLKPGSFG